MFHCFHFSSHNIFFLLLLFLIHLCLPYSHCSFSSLSSSLYFISHPLPPCVSLFPYTNNLLFLVLPIHSYFTQFSLFHTPLPSPLTHSFSLLFTFFRHLPPLYPVILAPTLPYLLVLFPLSYPFFLTHPSFPSPATHHVNVTVSFVPLSPCGTIPVITSSNSSDLLPLSLRSLSLR